MLPTEAGSEVHVRNTIWDGRVDVSTVRFTLIYDLFICNLFSVTKKRFYQDRFKYLHYAQLEVLCVRLNKQVPSAYPDSTRVSLQHKLLLGNQQ